MIHHMCETWSQHTWWICLRSGFGAPKPGCDRSGIKGMLTVGRNLDRTGQPLSTSLCYSDSFLNFSYSFLIYFRFTLITLIFFLPKTNLDFTLWNPVVKVTFWNRRPTLRNKNKTIFIDIYVLECLFLWYMSDLDLWLSVMSCGVMSTITSAYTYRKNAHQDN
jgi:hypothetical protein